MPKYFRKFVLATALKLKGKPILWEQVSQDTGVRAFNDDVESDKEVIAFLEDQAHKRRGGVTVISGEIYESLKKNRSSALSRSQPTVFEKLRVADREATLVRPKENPSVSSAAPAAAISAPEIRTNIGQFGSISLPTDSAPPTPQGAPISAQKAGQIYDNRLGRFVDPPADKPVKKFKPRKATKSSVEKRTAAPVDSDKVASA